MQGAVKLTIVQFSIIYLLLIIVLIIMKRSKIEKTKLLLIASIRMTVQMILTGFVLEYILFHYHPLFTVLFLAVMIAFSIHRVLSTRKDLNKKFQLAVGASLTIAGLAVLAFFVCAVIGKNIFNPQYTIPLAGMIIGNTITGMTIGLKTFMDSIKTQRRKLDTLLNLGADPRDILRPFVNNALEAALLPTMNMMLGMGIIFLSGMMTGQILSGTPPTTAILYQIAIAVAICAAVCLAVFCALMFGYRTLYNRQNQFRGI